MPTMKILDLEGRRRAVLHVSRHVPHVEVTVGLLDHGGGVHLGQDFEGLNLVRYLKTFGRLQRGLVAYNGRSRRMEVYAEAAICLSYVALSE